MRTLAATLTAAQKSANYDPLVKAVFSKLGQSDVTYTQPRIIDVNAIEGPWSQRVTLILNNYDDEFDSFDPLGWTCVLSRGCDTSHPLTDYSPMAPLYVLSSREVELSWSGLKLYQIELGGIFDMMAREPAQWEREFAATDTYTIKDLVQALIDVDTDVFLCYSQCTAFTVVWDSEDDVIDTFVPNVHFRVEQGDTRLSKLQELLAYTRCVARPEDDGYVHIMVPTSKFELITQTGGAAYGWDVNIDSSPSTSYDYQYSLSADEHDYFIKTLRNNLVIPSAYFVRSRQEHAPSAQYTFDGYDFYGSCHFGNQSDTGFWAYPLWKYVDLNINSNTEGQTIAASMMMRNCINSETGTTRVPMNVGQEVWDYILVDDVVGTIQQISWTYKAWTGRADRGAFTMSIAFGGGTSRSLSLPELEQPDPFYSAIEYIWAYLVEISDELVKLKARTQDNNIIKDLLVTDRLRMPRGDDADKEPYPLHGAEYLACDTQRYYVCFVDGVWTWITYGIILYHFVNFVLVVPVPSISVTNPEADVGGYTATPSIGFPTFPTIVDSLSDPSGTGSSDTSTPALTVPVPTLANYPTIIYESYVSGYDSDTTIYGDNWEAQMFQPQANHNVTYLCLYLKHTTTTGVGTVNIYLYPNDGGTPNLPDPGNPLQSTSINGDTELTTSYRWIPINITSQAVVSGTNYFIVVEAPSGDASNYIRWGGDGSSPSYSNGYRAYSDDDDSSWNQDTATDLLFQEGEY